MSDVNFKFKAKANPEKTNNPSDSEEQFFRRDSNLTPQQVREILDEESYEDVEHRQAIYERAYQQSPEEFSKIFSLIDRMEGETPVHVTTHQDLKGNEHIVALFKNMYGSNVNLGISNGQAIIKSMETLSNDDYKALARFIWMNGLDIELPQNIDNTFKTKLAMAQHDYEETVGVEGTNQNKKETQETTPNSATPKEEPQETVPPTEVKQPKPEIPLPPQKKASLEKLDAHMTTFMKRLGKAKNETYFRSSKLLSGDLVYRLYKSPDDAKKDGRPQKGGSIPNTYEIEIRMNVSSSGDVQFKYATPNASPIPANYAIEMVGMMKSQGKTHIYFEQPMMDADKGPLREACACQGVIPEGFNLARQHVSKMMSVAKDNLSDADLLVYKERMIRRLRKQVQNQDIDFNSPKNALKLTIEGLESEVSYYKLTDVYTGISAHLHSVARQVNPQSGETDAVKVGGAGMACVEFLEAYEKYGTASVKTLMESDVLNLPEEKAAFLAATGLNGNEETRLFELPPEALISMYKCMIKEQEQKLDERFSKHFSDPNREEIDSDYLDKTMRNIEKSMSKKLRTLNSNTGGTFEAENLGMPEYYGTIVPKNTSRARPNQGHQNYNNSQGRQNYNNPRGRGSR